MSHAQPLQSVKVAILAANGFEETELTVPRQALEDAGATTQVVSPDAGTIQGMQHDLLGVSILVDVPLSRAKAEHFDALLIPGGLRSPDTLRGNEQALDMVRSFFKSGKPVGAICHGPQVLISAGVVDRRVMTGVGVIQMDLENAGAVVLDEPVVVDQGLVTSRTPRDLKAFCEALVEEFSEGIHQGQSPRAVRDVQATAFM